LPTAGRCHAARERRLGLVQRIPAVRAASAHFVHRPQLPAGAAHAIDAGDSVAIVADLVAPNGHVAGRNKCRQAVLYLKPEDGFEGSAMREQDKLRERAAQLRALAIKAREDGKPLLADEITKLVIELSDQADALDRGERQSEVE